MWTQVTALRSGGGISPSRVWISFSLKWDSSYSQRVIFAFSACLSPMWIRAPGGKPVLADLFFVASGHVPFPPGLNGTSEMGDEQVQKRR